MGIYEQVSGALDHAAGSTDEAVARTTDSTQGGGVVEGTSEAYSNTGRAILDVPADAWEATTGTGRNLGWFGKIDKGLDPRDPGKGNWAKPSEATDGISGAAQAVTGVAGHAVDEATKGAGRSLLTNPKLLIGLVLAALVLLAPYADLAASAAGE